MKNFLANHLYDKAGAYKLSILTSPLFIVGLISKLYASAFFAGENFGTLFVPFLKYHALNGLQNPYSFFHELGVTEIFPYPQLMLYIMSLPGMIFKPLLDTDIYSVSTTELFIYHLPILIADVVILIILARWLKNKQTELLLFYWLSPILFYINYLHSQLDAIPIALVFVFLYFLFKEKWLISFLFLGAAIATKFHIVIIVPFVLVYLYRKHGTLRLPVACAGVIGASFIVLNNVQLLNTAFLTIVFNNREQLKIFDLQVHLNDVNTIYVIPLGYALLFLHSLTFKHFNRDTFVMFLGFSFGIITLFIAPMQGWYYWIIPFLIYFYVKDERSSKLPLLFITIAYFIYFATTPTSDYLALLSHTFPITGTLPNLYSILLAYDLSPSFVQNVGLTILQAALLINVIWIYRKGVEESKKTKLYNMPYLIGLAGDSGSGKTTLASLLQDIFSSQSTSIVAGDAMHKWERGHAQWKQFTHLNPRANKLHEDLKYAQQLQNGDNVYRRNYDHDTGQFTVPKKLDSKNLVIFEGLHSFFLSHMRQALDLKIFIKPDEQLRTHWKLRRDMTHRGYTKEKVLTQIESRQHDAKEYISVQEKYADITFSLKSLTKLTDAVIGTDFEPSVYLEITCSHAVDLEPLIETLATYVNIEHTLTDRHQIISLTGTVSNTVIEHLSYTLVPELMDFTVQTPAWSHDHEGIMQLFSVYYILESLDYHHARTLKTATPADSSLSEIAHAAQMLGEECAYVQGGGGNVSMKIDAHTMAVKASGLRLEELQENSGFVGITYPMIRRFFNAPKSTDDLALLTQEYEEVVTQSRASLPNSPDTQLRPSIETGFHAILDNAVIHTHSIYVNILTSSEEGEEILNKLFPEAAYIPYHMPGVTLTFAISTALKEHPYKIFFLENHGLVVTGRTVAEALELHKIVNTKVKKYLKAVNTLPEISITTSQTGDLVSTNASLATYLHTHAHLLSSFDEIILFPDQVVYGTKLGFDTQKTPITIHTDSHTINYDVSFKEAQAFLETFVAWVYILNGINERTLTVKTISKTEGELIKDQESEKYRQRIVA